VMPPFGESLTDDSRVIIYDHKMFIIEANEVTESGLFIKFFVQLGISRLSPKIDFKSGQLGNFLKTH
jgi:hypothetical protein